MKQSYPSGRGFTARNHVVGGWLWGSVGLFGWLWLFALASPAQAQQARQYLQNCDNANRCLPGLACAIQPGSLSGVCVHQCNPGDPSNNACPHNEPCNSQVALPGACVCGSNADCNQGACKSGNCTCINGQCTGTRKLGDTCDDQNACALGLLCSQVSANEKRCLQICVAGASGPICSNRMPCVAEGNFTVCKCTEDGHCSATGPGYFCRNGTCVNKLRVGDVCTQSNQCEHGLECAYVDFTAVEKRCFPRCLNAERDCLGGEGCVRPSTNNFVCRCDSNNPCPSGKTCVNGLCSGFDRCSPSKSCKDTHTCAVPPTGFQQGVCVKKCKGDQDCASEGALCRLGAGTQACLCTSDAQCLTGQRCRHLKCVKGCTKRSDCKFPEFCRDGICTTPQEGDDIGEPPVDGGVADAPVVEKAPKPEPKCNPPCASGQICNEATGKCEIRLKEIGESCEKAEECKAKLCVSNGRISICTKTCAAEQDCRDIGLTCRAAQGQQVCHYPDNPPGNDRSASPPTCGCQEDGGSTGIPLLLLSLFAFLAWKRRQSVQENS